MKLATLLASYAGYAYAQGAPDITDLNLSSIGETSITMTWDHTVSWPSPNKGFRCTGRRKDSDVIQSSVDVTDGSKTCTLTGLDKARHQIVTVDAIDFTDPTTVVASQSQATRTDGEMHMFSSLWGEGAAGFVMFSLDTIEGHAFRFTVPCPTATVSFGRCMAAKKTAVTATSTTYTVWLDESMLLHSEQCLSFLVSGCSKSDFNSMSIDDIEVDHLEAGSGEGIEEIPEVVEPVVVKENVKKDKKRETIKIPVPPEKTDVASVEATITVHCEEVTVLSTRETKEDSVSVVEVSDGVHEITVAGRDQSSGDIEVKYEVPKDCEHPQPEEVEVTHKEIIDEPEVEPPTDAPAVVNNKPIEPPKPGPAAPPPAWVGGGGVNGRDATKAPGAMLGRTKVGKNLFKVFNTELPKDEAEKFCSARGGTVAQVNTAKEMDSLNKMLTPLGITDAWLGAEKQDDGSMKWADGREWSDKHEAGWGGTDPTTEAGDCAAFASGPNPDMGAGDCDAPKPVVCSFGEGYGPGPLPAVREGDIELKAFPDTGTCDDMKEFCEKKGWTVPDMVDDLALLEQLDGKAPGSSTPPDDCATPRPFVCKQDPDHPGKPKKEPSPGTDAVAGVRYQTFGGSGTRAELEAFCAAEGGRVPKPDTPEKAALVKGILGPAPPSMNFGFFDDGDASISGSGGSGACTEWSGTAKALVAVSCDEPKQFMCEFDN